MFVSRRDLLGRAQPVIPPNLMLMNIIAWGPQVSRDPLYVVSRRDRH